MLIQKYNTKLVFFLIFTIYFTLFIFFGCKNPADNDSDSNSENPSGNTWVEFKNLERFPVLIYSDPGRNTIVTELGINETKTIASAPAPSGKAFYPTFHFDIFDIPGIFIPYNGPEIIASIEADKISLVPIPALEAIEINSAYIKIINNSNYSLSLRQGNSEKSPLGGEHTIILPEKSAVYEIDPGPCSAYSIMRNTTIPVNYPASFIEFRRGIIHVITYNGTNLTLMDEVSVLQTIPPFAPENVRAEIISEDSVRISWNEVYGATSYMVYRATDSTDASYSQVSNTTTLSWTDTGLTTGDINYYKISALSGGNKESGQSAAVSVFMMLAGDLWINVITDNNVSLAWDAVSGANSYNVYRAENENGPYSKVKTDAVISTAFTDTGLAAFTTYYYKISPVSGGAEGMQSNSVSGTTLLSAPLNVRISAVTDSTISLAWDTVSRANGYNIYRSVSGNGTYSRVNTNTVTGTAFTDTGLEVLTTCYYRISAVAGGIDSVRSNTVSSTTLLHAPQVNAVTNDSISIVWNAISGTNGYNVYRSKNENGPYTRINTGTITGSAFIDTDVSPYTIIYYYKISAVLGGVESIQSVHIASALPVTGNGLIEKLAWLQSNAANNMLYSIELNIDEYIGPQTLFYSGKSDVAIILSCKVARTINFSGQGSLFTVGSGVTLILNDNVILKGITNNNYSLMDIGGTLIMNTGSKIIDNFSTSYYGGGVSVYGTFIMNGGEISGNTATNSGGGVYVGGGTFTMTGGEISGNTRYGVSVYETGTFTMSGGKISGNTNGGVFVGNGLGSFTMNGGVISGNIVSTTGGGVYICYGTFTMNDGEISGNIVPSTGGEVSVYSGTFTMSGGKISGNSLGVYVWSSSIFNMDGGKISNNIRRGVHIRDNSTFTMNSGEISGNSSTSEGGGVYVYSNSTFTMNGGEISENSSSSYGGGVYVRDGTFTISGGKISGNSSTSGGGVFMGGSSTFTMSGGKISGNSSTSGGGVYFSVTNGTFTMTGGEIFRNSASSYGGGVYVAGGIFRMSGGVIFGNNVTIDLRNTAVSGGAALYLYGPTEYGIFNGNTFIKSGDLTTTNTTIRIVNGNLLTE